MCNLYSGYTIIRFHVFMQRGQASAGPGGRVEKACLLRYEKRRIRHSTQFHWNLNSAHSPTKAVIDFDTSL